MNFRFPKERYAWNKCKTEAPPPKKNPCGFLQEKPELLSGQSNATITQKPKLDPDAPIWVRAERLTCAQSAFYNNTYE